MRVFANMMVVGGTAHKEIEHDLGVTIEHKGFKFQIGEDNAGELYLRRTDGNRLIIKPSAANTIHIEGEK